jgi:hypothetical protein
MELETARQLFKVAGGRPIPVRLVPGGKGSKRGGGHYAKGAMVGIKGDRVQVKPRNGGGVVEDFEPQNLTLWTSRAVSEGVLTQDQINTFYRHEPDNEDVLGPAVAAAVAEAEEGTMLDEDAEPAVNEQEAAQIQERLEQATETPLFVVADLGYLHENRITFYMGQGSNHFTDDLSKANVFSGDNPERKASTAVSALQRFKQWSERVSSWANVSAIAYDRAKEMYDDCRKNASVNSEPPTAPPAPTPTLPPSPAKVNVPPVATPVDPSALLSNERVSSALSQMQSSMTNMRTAIDILKEERKNLLSAQQTLVEVITNEVRSIDSFIAMGEASLAGKQQ